ncbi:MAG: hypothetical protein PHO66_06760 [Eubacteriales bacterium]|nr:hypothetical protein [Eubacteriales bacterium]
MSNQKSKGLLGFAIKAGKAVLGMGITEAHVRRGKAYLVLLDGRASHNTSSYVENLCATYEVRCITVPSGFLEETTARSNLTVMALTDKGFARALRKAFKEP